MAKLTRKATAADFKTGATLTDQGGYEFTIMRPAAGVSEAWEARGPSGDKVVFECEAACYGVVIEAADVMVIGETYTVHGGTMILKWAAYSVTRSETVYHFHDSETGMSSGLGASELGRFVTL